MCRTITPVWTVMVIIPKEREDSGPKAIALSSVSERKRADGVQKQFYIYLLFLCVLVLHPDQGAVNRPTSRK